MSKSKKKLIKYYIVKIRTVILYARDTLPTAN